MDSSRYWPEDLNEVDVMPLGSPTELPELEGLNFNRLSLNNSNQEMECTQTELHNPPQTEREETRLLFEDKEMQSHPTSEMFTSDANHQVGLIILTRVRHG